MQFNPEIHPTYKEQFDKITQAYFADELNPHNCQACFVGNLLGGNSWVSAVGVLRGMDFFRNEEQEGLNFIEVSSCGLYSVTDINLIEANFMGIVGRGFGNSEKKLFNAMDSTLDMLRKLHEEKGEVIDQCPTFTKRQLIISQSK